MAQKQHKNLSALTHKVDFFTHTTSNLGPGDSPGQLSSMDQHVPGCLDTVSPPSQHDASGLTQRRKAYGQLCTCWFVTSLAQK